MNPFQRAYDIIKGLKTPEWLKRILNVVEDIAKEVFTQLGKEAMEYLRDAIFKQANLDITGKEKLENVVKGFREHYIGINITDYMLNIAIELLLGELKQSGILK